MFNEFKKEGSRPKNSQRGFTALELLVAAIIILVLATASVAMISRVEEWANVAQAKTEITQISMALEMEKYDTGAYTLNLADLGLQTAPSGINNRNWRGPYLKGDFYLDPWGNDYLLTRKNMIFTIPPGASSLPATSVNFIDSAASDSLIVESQNEKQITSAIIALNGTVIKTLTASDIPAKFPVTLQASNNLEITLNGESGAGLIVTLPRVLSSADNKNPYSIISRGSDKAPGGKGLCADIFWYSDYSDFRD